MKQLLTLAFIALSFGSYAQLGSSIILNVDSVKQSNKRPIDRIKIWQNGTVYNAGDVDVVCVWDDLQTVARFYYTLKDSLGVTVSSGNVEITGQKYVDYSTKPNHADRGVVLVMRELNLASRPQIKK